MNRNINEIMRCLDAEEELFNLTPRPENISSLLVNGYVLGHPNETLSATHISRTINQVGINPYVVYYYLQTNDLVGKRGNKYISIAPENNFPAHLDESGLNEKVLPDLENPCYVLQHFICQHPGEVIKYEQLTSYIGCETDGELKKILEMCQGFITVKKSIVVFPNLKRPEWLYPEDEYLKWRDRVIARQARQEYHERSSRKFRNPYWKI